MFGCPCVVFLPWLTLIADGLDLDRYVSRTCYGVDVYVTQLDIFLSLALFLNCHVLTYREVEIKIHKSFIKQFKA